MKIHKRYRITVKVKTHTKPLQELIYEKVGVLIRESKSYYIFDWFRVKKSNVIDFNEVLV